MKKAVVIGIVILIVGVIGVSLLVPKGSVPATPSPTEETVKTQPGQQAVSVVTADFTILQEKLSLHGTLSAWAEVSVVPKIPGRVARVPVAVGDPVKQGDILVQLETDELILQARQAEAALESARASLKRVMAGARKEEIEQAEAALDQAEANYVNARLIYERSAKLHEEGVMSGKDWDAVKAQFEVAKAQRAAAEKNLALIKRGARPEDIAAARAAVAQAEAAAELARLQVKNATITSPLTGLVSQVNVEVGDMAASTLPVATVVDISRLKLNLQVSEREVIRLHPGLPVTVTFDVLPGVMAEGRVATVAPAANSKTGLFAVTVEVPNEDLRLKPGMYGTAQVVVREKAGVLAVPARAVFVSEGKTAVYVVEDGIAHRRPVKVGIESDSLVEITAGLQAGDAVVVVGREFLSDGVAVRVVEEGVSQ